METVEEFKTLYKRTSKGRVEQWTIHVEASNNGCCAAVVTEHGLVGGKLQTSVEEVSEGKNLGKKNATTAREQALSQARAEWKTKLSRKGYTEDLAKAQAGQDDGAGGIRPMLAHKFVDYGDEVVYPCFAQPKLDGIRCVAVVGDDHAVKLWSREQKPIVAVPAVARAVEALGLPPGTVLDGELYNHELKREFEKIASCVRKQYEAPEEEQRLIQYHVYDLPRSPDLPWHATFAQRTAHLASLLRSPTRDVKVVQYVHTLLIDCEDNLVAYLEHSLKAGYEGCMARSFGAHYEEGTRSHHLLKLKKFEDGEYDVVGVYEGVGKMDGLALFVCSMEPGHHRLSRDEAEELARRDFAGTRLFGCKMEGPLENLRQYLGDESTWAGRKLTVKYQGLTSKRQVCRFPVGKSFRDPGF